jgi:hypothetical protein
MRKALVLILGVCLLTLLVGTVSARDTDKGDKRFIRAWSEDEFQPDVHVLNAAAQVDTYCIVWYDFEETDPDQTVMQDWSRVDNTAQFDTFVHVDDFSGLGGGSYGGLVPLEGSKSMWCGCRPGTNEYMCSWMMPPGYGNNWSQFLNCDEFPFTGVVTFSYHGYFDSEPGYDFTHVEYDAGGGNWVELAVYDGAVDTIASHEILLATVKTKLRFHFTSDGAWSDQDGLWNTDGGFIVDTLLITDAGGQIDYEDFEGCAINATDCGIWRGRPDAGYGSFAGRFTGLEDKDPCADNFGNQIAFFLNSPFPSSSYPGLFDTPFCTGPGGIELPCQDEAIVSPIVWLNKYSTACNYIQDDTLLAAVDTVLGGAVFRYTVYRDIPLANLVFYTWGLRSWDDDDCPGVWLDRNYVYLRRGGCQ